VSEPPAAPLPAAPPPRPRWRSVVFNLAKVLVAGGLIYWLGTSGKINREVVGRAFADRTAMTISFFAIGSTFICAILRWWVLLRAVGLELPLRTTAKLTMIGSFFNTFMPGAVGGDAFKMYYAVEHAPSGKKVEAATTVAMDRVIGLASMFLLVAIAMLVPPLLGRTDTVFSDVSRAVGHQFDRLWTPLGIMGGIGIVLLGASFHPGVRDWKLVARLRDRVPGMRYGKRILDVLIQAVRSPWPLIAAVLLSCTAHLATVACFFVVGRALGETTLGLGRYVFLVPIGLMVNAIPGSPAGIGIGEAAYEKLFAIALGSAAASPGADICVVWRAITIAWNLVGGAVYVFHRRGEADPALLKSEG
jgi:uncharacterized membrane protein YbhN (UPF0104 family)